MCAHAHQHQPLVLLHALVVVLGVPQGGDADTLLLGDLLLRSVPARQLSTGKKGFELALNLEETLHRFLKKFVPYLTSSG